MEEIKKSLQEASPEGKIACPICFKIARQYNCSVAEIGELCNQLKIKIVGCQLGCFN